MQVQDTKTDTSIHKGQATGETAQHSQEQAGEHNQGDIQEDTQGQDHEQTPGQEKLQQQEQR